MSQPAVHPSIPSALSSAQKLTHAIEKSVFGQRAVIDRLIIGLMVGGHVLLEGLPGLAKTLLAKSLAAATGAESRRIQFTPDLLPSDVVGTQIYKPTTGEFDVHPGPIISNIILADEVNRAPPKVQSALLEAMQEKQVTVGNHTFVLPDLFLVIATQNPIEQEGTYPLPEAQLDRFLFKTVVPYPPRDVERMIMDQMSTMVPPILESALTTEETLNMRSAMDHVFIDETIKEFILDLVLATRPSTSSYPNVESMVRYGASPRASIGLIQASKAHAILQQRHFVTPQDVRAIAMDILRHRVLFTFEAQAQSGSTDEILGEIIRHVPVP